MKAIGNIIELGNELDHKGTINKSRSAVMSNLIKNEMKKQTFFNGRNG